MSGRIKAPREGARAFTPGTTEVIALLEVIEGREYPKGTTSKDLDPAAVEVAKEALKLAWDAYEAKAKYMVLGYRTKHDGTLLPGANSYLDRVSVGPFNTEAQAKTVMRSLVYGASGQSFRCWIMPTFYGTASDWHKRTKLRMEADAPEDRVSRNIRLSQQSILEVRERELADRCGELDVLPSGELRECRRKMDHAGSHGLWGAQIGATYMTVAAADIEGATGPRVELPERQCRFYAYTPKRDLYPLCPLEEGHAGGHELWDYLEPFIPSYEWIEYERH